MKNLDAASYNERLFGGGLRGYLHLARYRWFASRLGQLAVTPDSVLELGCYDGRSIDFLPRLPKRYVGFDANWEDGLALARERWRDYPAFSFNACQTPAEMTIPEAEFFDIAVIMETLEHMPPEMVGGYLERIAKHTLKYVFITVPNEKGPIFLAKWTAKRLLTRDADKYTPRELWNATLGRMDRAVPYGHKGFDYQKLVRELSQYLDIVEVSGLPFEAFPRWLGFTVGIIGRAK